MELSVAFVMMLADIASQISHFSGDAINAIAAMELTPQDGDRPIRFGFEWVGVFSTIIFTALKLITPKVIRTSASGTPLDSSFFALEKRFS